MAQLDDIKTLGVLGAGQMGGGIAQVAAAAGYDVVLVDATQELADKARSRIGSILSKQVEKGKMTADAAAALVAHIKPAGSPEAFRACDFVVEAATENLRAQATALQDVRRGAACRASGSRATPRPSRSRSSPRRRRAPTASSACTS